MPMDGLTLGFIARELTRALVGGRIDKVSQPERDELLLQIRNNNQNHALLLTANAGMARAHLTQARRVSPLEPPMLCMLLRKHAQGGRVADIRQVSGDRILEIGIEHISELGDRTIKTLICEFMGKHSNLIFVNEQGRVIDSARRVTGELSRVREVLPGLPYERPPEHGQMPFDALAPEPLAERLRASGGALRKALAEQVSGLSRQTAEELVLRLTGSGDTRVEDAALAPFAVSLCALLARLPDMASPRLVFTQDGAPLDVTAFPYRLYEALPFEETDSLSKAMDAFYESRDRLERVSQKAASLRKAIRTNIDRLEKKRALQQEALQGSAHMEEYRVKGELLTAEQKRIAKGQTIARVPNYYDPDCAPIDIALDPKRSAAQNAQRYFKLYQKARSAQTLAAEQLTLTEAELSYFEGQLVNLENCEAEAELAEIRAELERLGYVRQTQTRRQMKSLPPSKPMRFQSTSGRDILVGKNNLQNDELTRTAEPDETWLHAKDIPGSHVIIVGENPDPKTLLEAALLAARYSKAGTGSNVPVDYTLRRYVKKPGGAKPGFVIYVKQRTLFVTPTAEALASIRPV